MTRWTVFAGDVECGRCAQPIPAGQPVALLLVGIVAEDRLKRRCVACAQELGLAVNEPQVDDARFEIERRAWAPETPAPPMLSPRHRPSSWTPLKAFSLDDLGLFDSKSAALGERDE